MYVKTLNGNKLFFAFIALGILLTSCNGGSGGGNNPPEPTAPLQVTPTSVAFTKDQTTQTITLHNTSSTITLNNPNVALTQPLSVESTNCSSSLAPNQTCSYTVQSATTNGGEQNIAVSVNNYAPINIHATYMVIQHYAYIANNGNNSISRCNVTSTGLFNNCITAQQNVPTPNSIVSNESNNYLYISSNTINNYLIGCNINNDGSLSSCSRVYPNSADGGGGISFKGGNLFLTQYGNWVQYQANNSSVTEISNDSLSTSTYSKGYINIASNGFVYGITIRYWSPPTTIDELVICKFNAQNNLIDFNDCKLTQYLKFPYSNTTTGMTISKDSKFIYAVTSGNQSVAICPITSNGQVNFDYCENTTANRTLATMGVVNNPIVFDDILYIPNDGNNTISACQLKADGTLGTCNVITGDETPFNQPRAVWII